MCAVKAPAETRLDVPAPKEVGSPACVCVCVCASGFVRACGWEELCEPGGWEFISLQWAGGSTQGGEGAQKAPEAERASPVCVPEVVGGLRDRLCGCTPGLLLEK